MSIPNVDVQGLVGTVPLFYVFGVVNTPRVISFLSIWNYMFHINWYQLGFNHFQSIIMTECSSHKRIEKLHFYGFGEG